MRTESVPFNKNLRSTHGRSLPRCAYCNKKIGHRVFCQSSHRIMWFTKFRMTKEAKRAMWTRKRLSRKRRKEKAKILLRVALAGKM